MNGNFIDISSKKFGKLTVLHRVENNSLGRAMWKCQCDCGKIKVLNGGELRLGKIKSCGCSKKELIRNSAKKKPYWWLYYKLQFVSKRTNKQLKITYEDYLEFTKIKHCHYCNSDIVWYENNVGKYSGYNLDRKNNDIGYTKDNCVVCCSLCNHIKGNLLTYEEMLKLSPIINQIQINRKKL